MRTATYPLILIPSWREMYADNGMLGDWR